MTRDFELVRKLLVYFDERDGDAAAVLVPDVGDEYSESQIKYHVLLLYQAGFVDGEPEKSKTSDRVIRVWALHLTWTGHEFLASIRSQGIWQRVKTTIATSGGAMTVEIIKGLATKYAKQALEIDL